MPTLDLMDVTKELPVRLDSVTLKGDTLTYDSDMIKDMFSTYLKDFPARVVFNNHVNWSNGYLRLQLKGEN